MGRGIAQTSATPPSSTTTTASDDQDSSSKLYPQELQLKLYQAFIFSIPILFSIILLLLFYLFYLKRRASTTETPPTTPARRFVVDNTTNNQPAAAAGFISSVTVSPWHTGMKKELIKEKLMIIQFDEDLRAKESICCVCLGEFELKEELRQVPSCKHVFHLECIQNWLRTNTTCPLCRCHVLLFSSSSSMVKPSPVIINPHELGDGGDR